MPQPYTPPYITATPEVSVHSLQAGDEFLVLATDGLWDRLSNEEVVNIIANRTTENVCTTLIRKVLAKSAPQGKKVKQKKY